MLIKMAVRVYDGCEEADVQNEDFEEEAQRQRSRGDRVFSSECRTRVDYERQASRGGHGQNILKTCQGHTKAVVRRQDRIRLMGLLYWVPWSVSSVQGAM